MRIILFTCIFLPVFFSQLLAQEKSPQKYREEKEIKLREKSPFSKIIDREEFAAIVYEDSFVIAFAGLANQAQIHYLIVPKKRIATVNDVKDEDAEMLGHLFIAARELARRFGIAESGFRLSVNTNQDAGQSVFHLHMHLTGGNNLGPIGTRLFDPKRKNIHLPERVLQKFTGQYQLPGYLNEANANKFILKITLENGLLFAQIGDLPKKPIHPASATLFFSADLDRQIRFEKSASGKDQLVLMQAGQQFTAPRIQ